MRLSLPNRLTTRRSTTTERCAPCSPAITRVAERADEHPKVFTSVKLVYTVRGRKLSKALIERAVSLSDEKYCSATAMIRKSAGISHEVVLVEI